MAINKISEFPKVTPSADDKILIEKNGEGGHINLSEMPVSTPVNTKIASEVSKLDSRINLIASLPQGSTSGDAELIGIREGADGNIYANAGTAVRTQFANEKTAREEADNQLKQDLDDLRTVIISLNNYDKSSVGNGYWFLSDGVTLIDNDNYRATNTYSEVEPNTTYNLFWVNNGTVEPTSWHYVAWYDANKNFISASAISTTSMLSPNNAKYVRMSAQTQKYDTFMLVKDGFTPTEYIPYKIDIKINDGVIIPSKLSGIKIDIIGDSWSAVNDTASVKYTNLLEENDNADINVLAVSGSGFFNGTSADNGQFYKQSENVRSDSDIVFVFGSFNDISKLAEGSTTIGDVSDVNTTSICGCINTTINKILEINPSAKILFATPGAWQGYNANNDGNNANNHYALEYVEAIKNVCYQRGYECKDMLRSLNLRPWITSFKNDYQPDGCHPNNAGHEKYLYPVIKRYLESAVC